MKEAVLVHALLNNNCTFDSIKILFKTLKRKHQYNVLWKWAFGADKAFLLMIVGHKSFLNSNGIRQNMLYAIHCLFESINNITSDQLNGCTFLILTKKT